jgi:nitroreductase
MALTHNTRTADHDIDPIFLQRWSPRAFTGEAMPQDVLQSLFEAARWAPSAINIQPGRFVYARRGTAEWEPLFGALMEMNQAWVVNASVLAYAISDRFRRKPGAEPTPNRSHSFDTGAAWACLALQASHLGWAAGKGPRGPGRARERLSDRGRHRHRPAHRRERSARSLPRPGDAQRAQSDQRFRVPGPAPLTIAPAPMKTTHSGENG